MSCGREWVALGQSSKTQREQRRTAANIQAASSLHAHQQHTLAHLGLSHGLQLGHNTVERCLHAQLHLHGTHHQQQLTLGNLLALSDMHGENQARHWRNNGAI